MSTSCHASAAVIPCPPFVVPSVNPHTMVRLTQHDVAACREAFAAHDGDAARLRAMMQAVKVPLADADIMDMCSQVAVMRPLHAVLSDPGAGELGVSVSSSVHGSAAVDSSGDSGFDMLLRMVEDRCRGVEDEEEDLRLAFMALGGNADGTGSVSASKMKTVVKVRAPLSLCDSPAQRRRSSK